ncbi:hypothetical protein Phep_1996 [Pedobacter heparinus DSM 2366]|uniref:Uncharacterized protein n=1 Tax=Pedobacter heparinus (strain ATCC 13125 / DSM 2366 / CIP 104194 / JCM 7457 / NBRC 12017 / NCIMB 9290 / NRRL B-14731 / HIM 762-3) TaxID=485917 RepID=C6XWQ9_PEDHD|nr:hypothetical protein Phep_1996 [Pedobacter heparinus DSM 2366]
MDYRSSNIHKISVGALPSQLGLFIENVLAES